MLNLNLGYQHHLNSAQTKSELKMKSFYSEQVWKLIELNVLVVPFTVFRGCHATCTRSGDGSGLHGHVLYSRL